MENVELTFRDKVSDVFASSKEDIKTHNLREKSLLLGMLACEVYQWGPFNEMVLGIVGADSIGAGESPIITAARTGGLSFATQVGVGSIAATSIRKLPETMKSIRENFVSTEISELKPSLGSRFLTSFNYGADAVILGEHSRDHERTTKQDVKSVLGSAALVGSGVFVIGGIVSYGAEKYLSPGASDVVVDIAKNPLTYLLPDLAIRIRRWAKRNKSKKQE